MPGEFPGGLVRAHQADTRQLHMPPVTLGQAERAGGEPARHPVSLALEPREPDLGPPAGAGPRRIPVTQRGREVRHTRGVGLLGVFRPPRRYLAFDPIPQFPQAVGRPRQRRRELNGRDAVGRLRRPLLRHQRQTPVERKPLPTTVRPQHRVLPRRRIEREPMRLDHHPNLPHTPTPPQQFALTPRATTPFGPSSPLGLPPEAHIRCAERRHFHSILG
jgi:hypothetical protein